MKGQDGIEYVGPLEDGPCPHCGAPKIPNQERWYCGRTPVPKSHYITYLDDMTEQDYYRGPGCTFGWAATETRQFSQSPWESQ